MEKEPQPNYYDEYEIDLREYILLLWENKLFIGGLVVLAILIAFFYSENFIKPDYRNSLTVQLANTEGTYSETESMNELIKSDKLIKPALDKKDLSYEVINSLNSSIISNLRLTDQGMQGAVYGGIINITATSSKKDILYQALTSIVEEFEARSKNYFEDVLKEKNKNLLTIENEINNLNNEINKTNEILNNLEDVSFDKAFIIANINAKLNTLSQTKRKYLKDHRDLKREINDHRGFRVLNSPSKSANKISPNINLNIAIAAVLAFMLAVFIVFFREFMREDQN